MTGLLHRLAARATGRANLLRPDLQRPHGFNAHAQAASALAPDDAGVVPPQTPQARPPRGDVPARSWTPVRPGSAAAAQFDAPPVPGINPQLPASSAQPAAAATGVVGSSIETLPWQAVTEQRPGGAAARPGGPSATGSSGESASRHPTSLPAGAQALPQPGLQQPGSVQPPLLPAAVAPLSPLSQLLPLAALPPAPPWTARAAAAQAAAASEQTTEVHIHIDRIDVTAVRDSAPSAPAARRRPAPPSAPSLDSYLDQRRRSG